MSTRNSRDESKRSFDWEGARRRIAEVDDILAGLGEPTAQIAERIWAQRAARLAQAPSEEQAGEQVELVLIRLGSELFGLDAEYALEIRPARQITPVPRVPDWVAGVVNVRGRILSVLDLCRYLALPRGATPTQDAGPKPGDSGSAKSLERITAGGENSGQLAPGQNLVIVETPDMEIALLVDDVEAVEMLPADRVQDATDITRGIRQEYVRGVAERKGGAGLLVVLNLPALLADEQLIVHEEIV
jgi:purine-binding chemotaxis protein CheW